jgi:hypothetical protein
MCLNLEVFAAYSALKENSNYQNYAIIPLFYSEQNGLKEKMMTMKANS